MRYVWASIFAVAIISLGVIFVLQTRTAVEQKIRKAAASGHPLPPGSLPAGKDIGVELSASELLAVTFADILTEFRYLCVVIVVIVCFGIAAVAGRWQRTTDQTSAPLEK